MENKYKGIWIYAEVKDGAPTKPVLEILGKARELKAYNEEEITAVMLGCCDKEQAQFLIEHGADNVILGESSALAEYSARPYEEALTQLVQKYHPSILLYAATSQGRDLAPRVMVSLKTGLTADAIDLGFDQDGVFYQTTPAYSGKLLANIVILEKRPQMATVHPGIFEPMERDTTRSGNIIIEHLDITADEGYALEERIPKQREASNLEDAAIIVSGGRGIKEQKDFELLKKLADLLNGSLACSRPVVDNGWLDHSCQLGQSGASVKPQLLFNFAISGSVQYSVGIQKARTIISVNRDKYAPIFDMSHYGAVTDYKGLVEALIEELEKRRGI